MRPNDGSGDAIAKVFSDPSAVWTLDEVAGRFGLSIGDAIFSGRRAKVAPPPTPGWVSTSPARRRSPRIRRTTTALVFTLWAIRSEVTGSSLA